MGMCKSVSLFILLLIVYLPFSLFLNHLRYFSSRRASGKLPTGLEIPRSRIVLLVALKVLEHRLCGIFK